MEHVNVAMKVKVGRELVDWALKAYRKHQKTYAKDVKRELAMLWIWNGGDLRFEDTDATIGLVEYEGGLSLECVHWDSFEQKWYGLGVVHAAWGDRDESTAVPIWVEMP